jgi:hypothetical protein
MYTKQSKNFLIALVASEYDQFNPKHAWLYVYFLEILLHSQIEEGMDYKALISQNVPA